MSFLKSSTVKGAVEAHLHQSSIHFSDLELIGNRGGTSCDPYGIAKDILSGRLRNPNDSYAVYISSDRHVDPEIIIAKNMKSAHDILQPSKTMGGYSQACVFKIV